jgi:hypothetical protein
MVNAESGSTSSAFAPGLAPGDLPHQAIHVPELLKGRPVPVLAAPAGARGQPDGEGLRKVIIRMLLGIRVPVGEAADMPNEPAAPRIRVKDLSIGLGEGTEELPPTWVLPKPEGIVERVLTSCRSGYMIIGCLRGVIFFSMASIGRRWGCRRAHGQAAQASVERRCASKPWPTTPVPVAAGTAPRANF